MRTLFNIEKNWKFRPDGEAANAKSGVSHSEIYAGVKAGARYGDAGVRFDDNDWRIVDLPHDRRAEVGFDSESDFSLVFADKNKKYVQKPLIFSK